MTSDGSLTLDSERYAESYRSRRGALTEARHVFLEASGVGRLLRSGLPVSVLEVGFGTGLNFLVTASVLAPSSSSEREDVGALRYTALENDLLPTEVLAALAYDRLLAPSNLPEALLTWLRSLGEHVATGVHRLSLRASGDEGRPNVTLELVIGDALDYLPAEAAFDAIYLDPFSPKVNPALWSSEFLGRLAGALAPRGRLVTYSVSGEVRRSLAAAGLAVRKVAGPPGGKREMLVAAGPGHRPTA